MNYTVQRLTFWRDFYRVGMTEYQMVFVTAASLAAFLDDMLALYAERDALVAELERIKAGVA